MKLSATEKNLIKNFKNKIEKRFPGEVINIIVFGSKARGDATRESDIDIIVITRSSNRKIAKEIRFIGYELEIQNNIILSIQVLSKDYIDYLRKLSTQFIKNVDKDAITI